jgi:HlyD family secretion protein
MSTSKKNSKKKIIIFSALGILLAAVIVVALLNSNKEKIVKVTTEKAQKRTITQIVTATGSIDPIDKVVITPEVTGEIVELPVKEGDRVTKGQLLVRIKPNIYIAQRNRAKASLQSAEANLKVRKANLDRAKSEFDRIKKLHEKGLASQQDFDAAKANYLSNEGQYLSQVAMVKQAEESLAEQEEDLAKTTLFAPLDGVISQLNVELGERVLGSGFSQGTNMMTVSNLENMEAVVDVDENDVINLAKGDTAIIKIDAFGDEEFVGLVYQIGNSAKTTGVGSQDQVVNFEVKINLLGKNSKIKPGMSCDADIQTETHHDVIAIPIQSLTARIDKKDFKKGKKNFRKMKSKKEGKIKKNKPQEVVFVLDGNQAKMVKVKSGISDEDYIEITKGLNGGETIITGPYKAISRELEDGTKVIVEKKDRKYSGNKN